MQLKDFIAETLTQIQQGIDLAGKNIRKSGSAFMINCDPNGVYDDSRQLVAFDVAVTTEEREGSGVKAGVFIAPFGLGGDKSASAGSSTSSRIQFSIPVTLPRNADGEGAI